MIRLAVICLPLLAMACASAREPEAYDYASLPASEHVPHPQPAYSPSETITLSGDYEPPVEIVVDRNLRYWRFDRPPGLSDAELNAALDVYAQSFRTEPRTTEPHHPNWCEFGAFAVRRHEPLELWITCDNGPTFFAYQPLSRTVTETAIIVTGSIEIATADQGIAINQDNTQERSE
jgi:hypothetical protein